MKSFVDDVEGSGSARLFQIGGHASDSIYF